jgi:hypothetical protein
MRNWGFHDEHQEQEVEGKNSKTQPIHGVCGHKITRSVVTQDLYVIRTKNPHQHALKSDEHKIHQQDPKIP